MHAYTMAAVTELAEVRVLVKLDGNNSIYFYIIP